MIFRILLGLLPWLVLAAGEASVPANRYVSSDWTGPERDFRLVDGTVVGPWWQGGGIGVAYFTGQFAQKLGQFEELGKAVAKGMGRPYLEIHKEDLPPNVASGNGALGYPDGTARVRLLIMPGGNATRNLSEVVGVVAPSTDQARLDVGRKLPQQVFRTGMNYIGVCAGAYTATSGYDHPNAVDAQWGLWPGRFPDLGPGISQPLPDVLVDPAMQKHPLWKATANGTLKGMFFNGGPLDLQAGVPDTEYFGRYQGGGMPALAGRCFSLAYRPAGINQSGRLVISSGHPEAHHREFLAAMAQYAIDHEYAVPRRPLVVEQPATAVCGEDQMHYWSISVPAGKKLTVTLEALGANCDLYVRAKLPPTLKKSDGRSARARTADEQVVIASTKEDEYWIGVLGRHLDPAGANYQLKATIQ